MTIKDSNPQELVDAIDSATAAGIRVSFGFLDTTASSQPPKVLSAVKNSRGVYATITVAAGSQNFINYVLLNGLTYNDNPQGYDTQLLSGLAETHFVSGAETVTLKYLAQKGERVNFTVTSISAGFLGVSAVMGGKELNTTNTTYSYSILDVTAPGTGELDLKITAKAAPKDSMFSVITNSNTPFKNCTVGVAGGGGGLSAGGKAGVGIGVTAALLGLGALGGYFAYKHFMGGSSLANAVPPSGGENTTVHFVGDTGAEKMATHIDVYPVDAMTHGLPPGDGGQGVMSGAPPPQSLAAPPAMQGGVPPTTTPVGSVPPTTAPMASPPATGMPLTGAPAVPGLHPMAFVPPLVPPNALNPNKPPPKEKGSRGLQGQQGDSMPQTMKDFHSGNYGQQTVPGQQQMVPNSAQPMAPGAPASHGVSSPAGTGGYPPHHQSQAPFGNGNDAVSPQSPGNNTMNGSQPLSPSPTSPGGSPPTFGPSMPPGHEGQFMNPPSQAPFGYGGEAPNMAPGSHAPTGTGAYPPPPTSQVPGNNFNSFSSPDQAVPMSSVDGYNHTVGGPGGQHFSANPPSSDPGFNPPPSEFMTGADSYNHHSYTMEGRTTVETYHHNSTMSETYHSSSPPSHGGTGSAPSTVPTSDPMASPPPTHGGAGTNPPGTDMYPSQHPYGGIGDQPHLDHPGSSQPNPSGADTSHHAPPDWNDYHDPDSCSCSEGPGPDSDVDDDDNADGMAPTPGTATTSDPGFYMPGAPFRPADKKPKEGGKGKDKHKHRRRRFPRLARSRVEKHHHHAWTGRDRECEDEDCVFNRADHRCEGGRECGCKCRDGGCEVYKRRLRERRHRDGGLTGALNVLS
jgi:hypothetical protein